MSRVPDDARTCAAQGCLHWSRQYPPDGSFLCGFHWMQRATKAERAVLRRLWRLLRKVGRPYGLWRPGLSALAFRERRCWSALVRRVS